MIHNHFLLPSQTKMHRCKAVRSASDAIDKKRTMSKFVRRNDPCPCGSGKKYKNCCLYKSDNPGYSQIENLNNIYKEGRKKARFKECIHPDKSHCSEQIIGAHTIQNNRILSKISDNGELYMPCPKPDLKSCFMYKYGRGEATKFTGFCKYHDKTTFQPIEDHDFIGTDEQVFLFIYRAFALEYHKKKEASKMEQLFFAAKPSIASMPGLLRYGKTGMQMAVSDFEEDKKIFDNSILNRKYDVLTYFIWTFEGFSNFAATGGETPTRDFYGNEIQSLLNFNIPARHIYLCVFPEKNKTFAIIAWLKRDDILFETIKKKLVLLNEEERKSFIINTIAISCENIVIKPSSWDALSTETKQKFESLFVESIYIDPLTGDMTDRLEKPPFDLFTL